MKLLKYLNKRGGRIVLSDIENPGKKEWGTAQEAMEAALGLEKRVNEVNFEICSLKYIFGLLRFGYFYTLGV